MPPVAQTMGFSEPDRIVVRGLDLCTEIIGTLDMGQMVFLELVGRLPTTAESRIVNAVLVSLVEHGITPSALATRLTVVGSPDALQASVSAGLLGVGGRLVGAVEGSAELWQRLAPLPDSELEDAIDAEIARLRSAGGRLPGIGHPVHKPVDPRTLRLFEIAEQAGTAGRHQEVAQRVQQRAEATYDHVLPLNVDGAIGATLSDLGFPWQACRGFALIARSAGLVAHALEELRTPIAAAVWNRSEAEIPYRHPEPLF